ncbi:MAG: 2-phospho-L-lactate transferase [Actinomycetota bacterium]
MKITCLAGGTGGPKLLVGLARIVEGEDLTAIVNTADDDVIYDVYVSPDVDIVTYWLAGIGDMERGWGLRGDTFNMVEGLRALDVDAWFSLGDRDFATCLFRTARMSEGATLSSVTDEIRRRLGVAAKVIPMSDDRVRTMIATGDGRTLEFQEYFVKERQEPDVSIVTLDGIHDAKPAPGVIEAIEGADRVLISPSNPLVSTGPILSVRGVREALVAHPDVVAISPIIRGAALKGPADVMLRSIGVQSSASGVASLYSDFCDTFVIDATEDAHELDAVKAQGVAAVATDTIMRDADASERIARTLLEL